MRRAALSILWGIMFLMGCNDTPSPTEDPDELAMDAGVETFVGQCIVTCDIDATYDLADFFNPFRIDVSFESVPNEEGRWLILGEFIGVGWEYDANSSYEEEGETYTIWEYRFSFACEDVRGHFDEEGRLLRDRFFVLTYAYDDSGSGWFFQLEHELCRNGLGCEDICRLSEEE